MEGYHDLEQATNGFSDSNLLGMGSFGKVYRGSFADGKLLAIKVFDLQKEVAFRSFDVECEVLRNLRHRNLTKVISCYSSSNSKALVLEYMHNGSLEKWLYSHNCFLDMLQRIDIMIDVASALEYLHHGYSTTVIHCDIKPNNILLDEHLVAHVSDFGIAKMLDEGETVSQTITLATLGYMAPEYGQNGLISTMSDVYSYGIVLMETFTRVKPTNAMFGGDFTLKRWVGDSMIHDKLNMVVDANLINPEEIDFAASLQCVSSIMELALDCCSNYCGERIKISDALAKLKKIKLQFTKSMVK